MKSCIAILSALVAVPALAQTPPDPPPIQVSGSIMPGVESASGLTESSKLTEYRDIRDDAYLATLRFSMRDPTTGWHVALDGANVSRRDQTLLATGGRPGVWNFEALWTETPHNLSLSAQTPYISRRPGLLEVPATIPITFKKLQTSAADAPSVRASDDLVAAYQASFLMGTTLGTQTKAGHFAAAWSGANGLGVEIDYDTRGKSGGKPAFGPIGDRPPRTLDIQLTEPVDYRTNDLTAAAEHEGRRHTLRVEYFVSDFTNHVDTLEWQNVFTTPEPGASSDAWDRSVSAYGRRPLPPDNTSHRVSATVGIELPRNSRLTTTAAYGRLQQNATLLPYSFNVDRLVVQDLPRATADASLSVVQVLADYVINPADRLNLRGWMRHHGLDNNTPQDRWQYVTSDTSNLNGTTSYKNRRNSLAYAVDRTTAGVDATYRLPSRSSVTLGYAREDARRDFREADTVDHRLSAALRTRPRRWMNVRARYVFGNRDGGEYDSQVTRQSYWYAPADVGADNDNPALTFSNHPDMRRFDVSDRRRHQVDVTVNLTPRGALAITGFIRHRDDDFASGVVPAQPLLGSGLADATASTPGDQLGLLEDRRTSYGLDVFVQPNERASLNAFLNYDLGSSVQRSLEYNENNKQNPSTIGNAELGPWTRAGSQWTADTRDRTWSAGLSSTLHVVPERLTLVADYTLSLATVDIAYDGFGVTNFDGTPFPPNHQFAFSTPPPIREDMHVTRVRAEVPIRTVVLVAQYSYENFHLDDWQQGSSFPWVEPVGADTLLRDTSRSHQWGNRLFSLGTFLAPSYSAHVGFVGFRYGF